jgi:hypothetical protein
VLPRPEINNSRVDAVVVAAGAEDELAQEMREPSWKSGF